MERKEIFEKLTEIFRDVMDNDEIVIIANLNKRSLDMTTKAMDATESLDESGRVVGAPTFETATLQMKPL